MSPFVSRKGGGDHIAVKAAFLNVEIIINLCGISLPTVCKWTKDGYLRFYRLLSRILYKSNEVEVAMKERMFMRGSF